MNPKSQFGQPKSEIAPVTPNVPVRKIRISRDART